MSENANSDGASLEPDKPAQAFDDVKFPPLPEPGDSDFEDDVGDEEKAYYRSKFPDLNEVVNLKLHCTACDRHLGCSSKNESRMRSHPMLKTLICHACHSFYNSGEFDKGEDGSELYCRWCGQGGQVYCCSDCIHVFCAKCIKRNLGVSKIKEIENTDDWKCFKCNPKCLWDLRAICWALLHFCDLRTRIVNKIEDPILKEKYMKIISVDSTECCRNKGRKREKTDSAKKKEKDVESIAKKIISKIPPTIQVKKFASISLDETPKSEKKAQKRPASPKIKTQTVYMPKPVTISTAGNNILVPPLLKKIRLPNAPLLTPARMSNEKKLGTYSRYTTNRPRAPFPIPIMNSPFNGFNSPPVFNNVNPMNNLVGDNINLSLETLTQGLDMSAVAAFNNSMTNDNDNDVVCTPDFPMEPLCEVTEDNDDDVECITPGPAVPSPKISNPPPLVSRISDLSKENIVQMTENDVTVNAVTGGLKFRVDPQTLSSKKMYRLPDGRIFAINPNPNMPGGYSATIVSVSEGAARGGETYAAKLSSVLAAAKPSPSPKPVAKTPRSNTRKNKKKPSNIRSKRNSTSKSKETESTEHRKSDFKVPVEWYRYNLIDAVDALEYSLSRLNKLKKETPTAHLRTRTVEEMKYLHRSLEQLLTTSSKRFVEIRDSLNREFMLFIAQKKGNKKGTEVISEDEDDDDVEILADAPEDPIFIDENSADSADTAHDTLDLTGAPASEHNDSGEHRNESDPLHCNEQITRTNREPDKSPDCSNTSVDNPDISSDTCAEKPADEQSTDKLDKEDESGDKKDTEMTENNEEMDNDKECVKRDKEASVTDAESDSERDDKTVDDVNDKTDERSESSAPEHSNKVNGDAQKEVNDKESMDVDSNEPIETQDKADRNDEKTQGLDMSEDLINTLLQDDHLEAVDNVFNTNSLDIPDDLLDKE